MSRSFIIYVYFLRETIINNIGETAEYNSPDIGVVVVVRLGR